MSWLSRIANAFRSSGVDRALDEEMSFHIESRIRDLVAGGMTRDAAETMARRQFGNRLRLREQSRDVKLLPWLDSLVRDVRLGARMLLKNRLVTSAAIVSLSLALSACVAAFSLVDALILRPLPVHQPERLVYLTYPSTNPDLPEDDVFSDPAFVRLRDAGRGRVDLFALAYPSKPRVTFDVASGDRETVRAQFVSGDAFERLGVGPAAGRLLTMPDDQRPGAHPVAVLSHALWMQRFGGDPGIVGLKIPLLAGRTFVRGDLETESPTTVIVNNSFAKRYFGGEPAVGRLFDARYGRTGAPNEVVGVVADVRYDLRKPPAPTIYILLPLDSFRTLHVRVAGDATTIAARLREEVRAATPLLRVTSVTSQAAVVNRTVVRERLLALLGGFFALVGLVLTTVGLYAHRAMRSYSARARSASASRSERTRSARCGRYWQTPPARH